MSNFLFLKMSELNHQQVIQFNNIPYKGSLIVVRMIYKDIDHGNLSVHHGTATLPFTSKEKNSQQPQREVDCAIVSGAYFLWIYDITVCECGSSCSSFLRHTHHLYQARSGPSGEAPCWSPLLVLVFTHTNKEFSLRWWSLRPANG